MVHKANAKVSWLKYSGLNFDVVIFRTSELLYDTVGDFHNLWNCISISSSSGNDNVKRIQSNTGTSVPAKHEFADTALCLQ
jgi:hypothetical protein